MRPDVLLFFRAHILAGQDKDGEIGSARVAAPLGEQFEATHLGEDQITGYQTFPVARAHSRERQPQIRPR